MFDFYVNCSYVFVLFFFTWNLVDFIDEEIIKKNVDTQMYFPE